MIKASRTKNYLRGLASGYVVTLATVLVGLFITPFVLRYLDREQFAVFTLAGDVLMWLGLLELGITAVLNVKAAQLSGKPDQSQLNQLASTTFFAQCAIAILIGVVGSVVTVFFPDFFGLRPDLRHDAMLLMALMVLGSALQVGTQTFSALLIAHQQMHVDNAIRLGLLVIRTGLTVFLLIQGFGLISLAIAQLVAIVITGCLAVFRVFRLLPALSLRWRYFCWDVLKQTGGLGVWFSLGGLAGILIMNLDKIVTAKFVSVEMVTTLALTGRLYVLAWTLVNQFTSVARPALAQMLGEGNRVEVLLKYRQIFRLSSGLAIVAAASVWAGNSAFVSWWVGPANYGGSLLDAILALNLIVHAWILPSRAVLTAGLVIKPQTLSRVVEGGLNLIFSILLAVPFGVVGVALSTSIAGVLTSVWYLPRLVCDIFQRAYGQFVLIDALPLLILLVSMGGFAFAVRSLFAGMEGFVPALLAMASCGLIGATCLWLFVFDAEMRATVRRGLAWQQG